MVKQRKGVIKEELIMPIRNVEPKFNTPTPEQMRIAQILEKKVVDSTIKLKLTQIMDATQRSADEVYVALHDSDFDVNRAVNLLIEGENQLADWCTSEKRKKKLAELKEKKEEVVETEVPQPDKKNSFRGRDENKRRPGRKQDNGRQTQKPQDETRRPPASSESKAPRGKRTGSSGFGSMVFERSNPPPIDPGFLPPVRNQWEKPLLRANGPEDDWDSEEFQGSLSQTQIFTSSKRHEPREILDEWKTPKVSIPRTVPSLLSLTFTNKARDPSFVSPETLQKRDSAVDMRPNASSPQENPVPSKGRPSVMGSQDIANVPPSQDAPSVIPTQARPSVIMPGETRSEYVYQMSYTKSHHEDKRPPSRIPTLPVEMPPELKPSLSFLDIQFGAMDLFPLETSSESQSNHSNTPSQNPIITTLMSSLPSSCSVTHIMSNTSISSLDTNNVNSNTANTSECSPVTSTTYTSSPRTCSITNPPVMIGISSPPGMNSITSLPDLNNTTPGISSITNHTLSNVNQSLNSIANSSNSIVNQDMSTAHSIPVNLVPSSNIQQAEANMGASNNMPNSHMVSNTVNHSYGSSSNQRFMPSSQAFNSSHMQYGIINPPVTTHGYDSRDNAPPHLPQHRHLPPFKSPPGVPKGGVVPNLPPGSLMGNQYIVGQGNVPYFPHPPIYYYEEVQPVMNTQQRVTNMTPHHFDVAYQTAPSTRENVHYNL